jgi:integrase
MWCSWRFEKLCASSSAKRDQGYRWWFLLSDAPGAPGNGPSRVSVPVHRIGSKPGAGTLNRHNAWTAIRKRAHNAGFLTPVGCHTWRATGVTVYLENGGRLEHAQQMAAHESPRTTKLYDRTKDEITIGEVERIQL